MRDAPGALVDNLSKEDVAVYEDAVPQKISFFAKSTDVPLTMGLIVDVSRSQDHSSKQHEHDLEVFLKEVFGPKDRAFFVTFANHIRLVSDFSPSGPEIIGRMQEDKKRNKGKNKRAEFPELGSSESRDLGTAFYDAIYDSVTEKIARESGRRALLVFSDAEDNSSSHHIPYDDHDRDGARRKCRCVRHSLTEKEHGKLTARNKYGTSVMDRVAKETAGAHIDAATTDPHAYSQRIAQELRTSYELAYYPANSVQDETFRKIVIRPKQAGFRVRTKTGYFSR